MAELSSFFNRVSLVKQIPIFNKLSWLDLQRIAIKSKILQFRKGEVICRQGDPPDAFYGLVSGRIQAYALDFLQKKKNVEFIHRGTHFGVISLLTGEPHSLTFEAINDSIILKIEQDDFNEILKSIPNLGVALSHNLSKRVRHRGAHGDVFESTIISIYSPIKGAGSSTYSFNLAMSLQRESKKKVLWVTIGSWAEEQINIPSEDVDTSVQWKARGVSLNDMADDPDVITGHIIQGQLPVDLLHVNFNATDQAMVDKISQFVSALVNNYHYVIVDLPNQTDEVVLKTLIQSDIVQLVTQDKKDDLLVMRGIINQLEQGLQEQFRREQIQIVISGRQAACYLSYEDIHKEIDFEVFTKLPHIDSDQMQEPINNEALMVRLPGANSEYGRAVTKIARQISGVQVGLVLGGGAALGLAHIGVIKVLEQERIPIDVVVGSSMGALLASFWVIGNNAMELENLAREFEKPKNMWKIFDPIFPISGLMAGHMIKRWLRTRGLGNKTFYSTRIPLKVVAYDLVRRQELVVDSGLLVDAVRKSISIPGVMTPVLEGEQMIIDGGVLNPLPTNVLMGLGIKKIIAVNVLQSPQDVTYGFVLEQNGFKDQSRIPFGKAPGHFVKFRLWRAITKLFTPNISDIIVRSLQASEYLLAEQSAQNADVNIHPDLVGVNWYELYKVDDLIKRGEAAARQALPAIKKLLEE